MSPVHLPMFPLGLALLPGQLLPLHIFEPRYRQMMGDVLQRAERESAPPTFGVVLIERGAETGGGDLRAMVATRVIVMQTTLAEDGRYGLICAGWERVRVLEWLVDDPYPQAMVEIWPDTDSQVADAEALPLPLMAALEAGTRRLGALAVELGDPVPSPVQPLVEAPRLALYQLIAMSPLGMADRQDLLATGGAADRAARFRRALDEAEDVLTFRLGGS